MILILSLKFTNTTTLQFKIKYNQYKNLKYRSITSNG